MNQKFIVIDGKTYKSVDEMPPDVRRQYEEAMRNFDRNNNGTPDLMEALNPFVDKNNDGMPDAFENLASMPGSVGNVMSSTKIIVNGQSYDDIEQLPPDVRAKYQKAMGAMDANGNGVPDFMEGMMNISNQATSSAPMLVETSTPLRSKPIPVSSTIEPESSGGWMLVVTGVVLAGTCLVLVAAGIWYFFLQ